MLQRHIRANGIDQAYLEVGDGPTVMMLHGYPDNAWTWEHQAPALAAAGYRVVAPFLRGYPPSTVDPALFHDRATLAKDVAALIETINNGQPVILVGQDWGAAITYGVLAAYPSLVSRAVVMAIPHPTALWRNMTPEQIERAFHWWFFQLPNLPEQVVPANDFAFIDHLWANWSPGHADTAHVARIKAMLAAPGAVATTLDYYRAVLNPLRQDPALAELRSRLDDPITVQTLALCGADDVRVGPMSSQADCFAGPYRFDVVPGCGHFLHRERPDEINRRLLDWFEDRDAA